MKFMQLVMFVNASQIFYTGMFGLGADALAKYGVGVFDYSFTRSLVCLITTYIFFVKPGGHRVFADIPADKMKPLIVRSIVGTF